jgi:molybdenum cofactor cytidylyltransferase
MTAVVLLAAGGSTRMGRPKQALTYNGEPLLRRAATAALDSGCGPVFVVLGAHEDALKPLIEGLAVTVVRNEEWQRGIGTSIRAGVRAAAACGATGAVLALADQPMVNADTLSAIASRIDAAPIGAARYAGTLGVPACFDRRLFPELLALRDDEGCKQVILRDPTRVLTVDCPEATLDIDTPEDYSRLSRAR